MEYIFSFVIGYLAGSFPTAYLLLKKSKGLDISQNGSGNVGAINSYRVTKSKLTAISVFIIDLLKGLATVYFISLLMDRRFDLMMIGLIGSVFSHCYSPWIKLKGGRGLATAAGGGLLISIPILALWAVIWIIAFIFRRNIYFGNFTATLLTCLLSLTSAEILMKYTNPTADSQLEFGILVSLLFIIILTKHIKPIKEYFISQNKKLRDKKDESN